MSIRQWHVCVNISQKLKGQCSQATKQASNEDFENNMRHHDTL